VKETAVSDDQALWRTSIHEAGHAVAAAVQGLATHAVTIEPAEDYLGARRAPNPTFGYVDDSPVGRRQRVRAEIVAAYAGLAAEHIILGEAFPLDESEPPCGAQGDFAEAWRLVMDLPIRGASFVGDEAYDRADGRLRRQAVKLMTQHRMTVERLAKALLKAGTLSGEDVEAIIS
jgi:ATP-dependent Zn protease